MKTTEVVSKSVSMGPQCNLPFIKTAAAAFWNLDFFPKLSHAGSVSVAQSGCLAWRTACLPG